MKFVPVTVTRFPTRPRSGVKLEIVGWFTGASLKAIVTSSSTGVSSASDVESSTRY